MERARPFVVESKRLCQGAADDVAGFVGKEEFWVKRNDRDRKGMSFDGEFGRECFEMIEDSLFGFLHLLCGLAGDGDFYYIFCFHNNL